ncbi:MAG: epoxyqueuosine reductase [Comamonadaceae bacterium BICA1-1]|nr:MAG: epoxyqueuosine reductase [Comamonadaceae bacterium BICA1-1]
MFDAAQFVTQVQGWGRELGFSQIGVAGVDLRHAEAGLLQWLQAGFHGEMGYMAAHGLKRARPAELVPGTLSVITARMDYLPASRSPEWREQEWQFLQQPLQANVALYARGRDYHKVLRQRLRRLAERIEQALLEQGGPNAEPLAVADQAGQQAPSWRVFTDSAPVLEVELAQRSGLGWRGKHTLALSREAGSMFFLGEIFLNFKLPPTAAVSAHCGQCQACLDVCPTQAIVAPYRLDARRCIAYLTIEHAGPIAPELRPLIGNRIYGCDDCQLVCPWNKYAQRARVPDFEPRAALQAPELLRVWAWSRAEFEHHTEGSPIRRIGHERWLRNVAVALGNALASDDLDAHQGAAIRAALHERIEDPSPLVREHVRWALAAHGAAPAVPDQAADAAPRGCTKALD